jgi:ABC-2 type transport system ATP-binding protein
MIRINNLNVSFAENKVLKNLSIDFIENHIHGIVGLNGAGKTTFFNTIAGNIKPDSGEIIFHEKKLSHFDIAYLETVNYFYSRITGNEYLKIFKQTNADFNLTELQNFLRLPLDEIVETYSTGMKKKLALLGILKQNKSIFLLDEPFNGLDLETNKILELIIEKLKIKSKTVILSSHIIEPLITVCDQIHYLVDGIFIKTFMKNDFSKIDEELFSKLKSDASKIISTSI